MSEKPTSIDFDVARATVDNEARTVDAALACVQGALYQLGDRHGWLTVGELRFQAARQLGHLSGRLSERKLIAEAAEARAAKDTAESEES